MKQGQRRAAKVKRRKERQQVRYRTILTNGHKIAGLPSMGESMTCIMCSKVGQSDPKVQTDWRMIKADDVPYYVCTDHFPPDTASAKEFEAAYTAVMNRIMEIRAESEASKLLETQLFTMPTEYVQPLGTPLYWSDEVTGVLPAAVLNFISHCAEPDIHSPPTADHLALVIGYLRYYINAPCWVGVQGLRDQAAKMTTAGEIGAWLNDCVRMGLDPL